MPTVCRYRLYVSVCRRERRPATLATPLELPDSTTAAPSGRQVRFDAVDVLIFEDGRIARKDTYVDSLTLQQQLAEAVATAA
jgi:biopolymer transport protein ExbD